MQTYTVTVDELGTTRWRNSLGQLHREDGPAVERADGSVAYWIDNKLHREDGPAVEYADGERHWYQNGKVHRVDGPAIEYADGSVAYWIDNKKLTQAEFEARNTQELTVAEVEALLGYKIKIKS
jgi:4-hydroxyphenylpyruvate dioxygenase-like putative hemolysin